MMLMMLTMWTDAGAGIGFITADLMIHLAIDLGENHPDRLIALYCGPWGEMVNGD